MPTPDRPRIVAIIQARMRSTRLPGKVLLTVLDRTLLDFQIERLRRAELIDELVVATTILGADDPIAELCRKLGVACFRGSENDVLSRYLLAADANRADAVVRITSDCPVIDPRVVDSVIRSYVDHRHEFDYVSNIGYRTFPRGMDTEVVSAEALYEAYEEAYTIADREHVTRYIYTNPDRFRLHNVRYVRDESRHRWTVDMPEDLELIRRIVEELYPVHAEFTLEDMLELMERHPEWALLNAHVAQKG